MDVLGSTGQVELSLSRTQLDEERQIRALASGLRVVSASDDPSGLAIAENIQTQVLGLQQGVQNVQTANNLLDVADGALATVQQILQRIHGLIIQASSDINSESQLQSIQDEIDTLLKQVNDIAGRANFNGVKLLDGSLATTTTAGYQSSPTWLEISPPDGEGSGTDVYDATGTGTANSGPLISQPANGNAFFGTASAGYLEGFVEVKVESYSSDPVDPNSGALGMPGVYLQVTTYSTDPNFGGANGAPESVAIVAVPTGTGVNLGAGTSFPQSIVTPNGLKNMLVFNFANLSQQDVGVTQAFETFAEDPSSDASGQALQIQSGANEGDLVQVSLPSVTTSALGISSISVLDPESVDWDNRPSGTVTNTFAAADAEGRVQNAIDLISQARAQVGAQSVSLQEDANDASVQIVNQTASESAIRDVDVGQSVTQFTKDQIMTEVGTSVLAQMHANAQLVIQLVNGLNPGTNGKV